MSEKTSVLLSDVTIKGNVIEKEKLMTDAKIEGDVSAEVLQTFEGSNTVSYTHLRAHET